MCEVQLMRISQNSLHVISTFRIPVMAIRMAQITAFRRNNGVRCVIVGVASFTYVKEANDTKKSVHSPTPAPLRLALQNNESVMFASLWHIGRTIFGIHNCITHSIDLASTEAGYNHKISHRLDIRHLFYPFFRD